MLKITKKSNKKDIPYMFRRFIIKELGLYRNKNEAELNIINYLEKKVPKEDLDDIVDYIHEELAYILT